MTAAPRIDLATTEQLEAMDHSGIKNLPIYQCYKRSPYLSVKHSSYFYTYERLLSSYRGKKFTFVEIGVSNGGSLLMWREYFGPDARIIGIDFNPEAKRFEADGFEIHIGSQASPEFWQSFFASVGNVDIILDDGGHTNEQQIITCQQCIPHINDGGMLIVEDTHASYLKSFGNPSPYSFTNYAKTMVDAVNSRFPSVNASGHAHGSCIHSIRFFESIVCFDIARRQCITSIQTTNNGQTFKMKDYRRHGTPKLVRYIRRQASRIGLDAFGLKRYFN